MSLRKCAVLIALVALVMLLSGHALAAGAINPNYRAAQPPVQEKGDPTKGIRITVNTVQTATLDQDGIWNLAGDGATRFCVYVLDADWDTCYYSGWSSATQFRYRFVVAGNYTLYIQASGGNDTGWNTLQVTVADDDRHPTLEEKISQLASQCLRAGCRTDFDKALWMHDWLVNNASYDRTNCYYSADGVLVRGVGVCDSYRKAYQMLLEAVGVECTYATGGNHAWNQVKLDGKWYNVDVTWDDPISGSNPARTGKENHVYFALPDELLEYDHTFATRPHACTAYDENYYLQTGNVQLWTESLESQIIAKLQQQRVYFSIDVPRWYRLENGSYGGGEEFIVYNLAGYALGRQTFGMDGSRIRVSTRYLAQGDTTMQVMVSFSDATLSLPAALGAVPDEMFAGNTAAKAALVPEGVTSIGTGAFNGCTGLMRADISDSVTSIGRDAFRNCPELLIVCGENTAAHAYARANNIAYVLRSQVEAIGWE